MAANDNSQKNHFRDRKGTCFGHSMKKKSMGLIYIGDLPGTFELRQIGFKLLFSFIVTTKYNWLNVEGFVVVV